MSGSNNIYDLLNNEEQHSKKPTVTDGPGKPDKTEQRRSVPKAAAAAATATAAGASAAGAVSQRARVDDRDRRGGRGGASRGGRGGRGGYGGIENDGVHRNFDRKQGEHARSAPGEARKHGAVGEVDASQFAGSSSAEVAAANDANALDANGDIIGELIMEMTPAAIDPEDLKITYADYLANKQRVDEDVNRQTREVTNDGDFKSVKQFVKEAPISFGDAKEADEHVSTATGLAKKNKKGKISLDEFVGAGAAAPAASSDSGRGGRGGARGGAVSSGRGGSDAARGGRGGYQGGDRSERSFDAPRRGGFEGAAPRGGRGGYQGQAPRGGRGGFQGQARAAPANVNLADQSAFPALSPK